MYVLWWVQLIVVMYLSCILVPGSIIFLLLQIRGRKNMHAGKTYTMSDHVFHIT